MPTYEYACRDCGEHLEVVQSFKDDALTECPNCSGELRKVFSAAGIIFKGSGWHIKDYGSSKGGSTSAAASEGSSDASSGKDTPAKDSGSKDAPSKGSGGKDGSASTSSSTTGKADKSA